MNEDGSMSSVPDHIVHVLCVDDEVALLELTKRLLMRLGCQVTAHANPADALADLRSRPRAFDLLITDISMPGMSGFSLIAEARQHRPDLHAVVSTGCVSAQDVEVAESLGNIRIIQKSSTMDDYLRVLMQLVAGEGR
jgi:CheY-like chemotaxis protein